MAPTQPDAVIARRRVSAGVVFMISGRLVIRCFSVVSTLVLARLLMPEDFGLVALASSIFLIVDLLSSTNFTLVLVRRATVDRDFYDTAWTMNLIRYGLLAAIVAATAGWQADLLGDARLGPVLMLIAFNVALDGFASIGLARLQREFRFDLLFRHQVASRLIAFVATIAIAVVWRSYWALILGNVFAKVVSLPYGYWLAPHRPRLCFAHWRELLSFSKWSMALNACMIADGQGPNLVLGRMIGVEAVGTYNIAYQVAAMPVTEIAAPIRGPIYAGYARNVHDTALLSREFLDGFALLFTILVPLSVGIALVAPEIEMIALGPRWAGVAPLMTLCALYALVDAMAHFTFNLFTVMDRMSRFTATYAAIVAMRIPTVIVGVLWNGPEGALTAMLATGIVNALLWHHQTARLLGHRLLDVGLRVWRGVLAAAAMTLAVLALRAVLPPATDLMGATRDLGILSIAGAAVHVATQWLLWRLSGATAGPESRLMSMLAIAISRLRLRSLAATR